jgi:hypothetical protein
MTVSHEHHGLSIIQDIVIMHQTQDIIQIRMIRDIKRKLIKLDLILNISLKARPLQMATGFSQVIFLPVGTTS